MWGQFSLTKRPDDLPFDVIKSVLDFSRNRSFTPLWTVGSGGTDQALPRSGEDQRDRVRPRHSMRTIRGARASSVGLRYGRVRRGLGRWGLSVSPS